MKKYDEDLNTTLIFVRYPHRSSADVLTSFQAGLFSAVTSAFIIEVNSQLQPDPNSETAALLRILIYKIDNTTFGNNPPTLPQWTGPPHTIVQVQAILFASLAASLFSAFLAMLGKQWLNQYASIDMRGSTIERSQNRQWKLDGIINWYFDHVMESLPFMLQVALLLLGGALSWYFWDINTTVASVVLAITSFGVLLYLFIVFVGTASPSCPYQTPVARVLKYILHCILDIPYHTQDVCRLIQLPFHRTSRLISNAFHRIKDTFHSLLHLPGVLRSIFPALVKQSSCCFTLIVLWETLRCLNLSLLGIVSGAAIILISIPWLAIDFVIDTCRVVAWVLVMFARVAHRRSEQQMAVLDQRCISWTLRTSLDGPVRLSALSYLATTTLANFDPTLVVDCFNIFFGCIKSTKGTVVITQGMERLARVSTLCCLQTLSHLITIDPTSRILGNTRQRYAGIFQSWTDFDGLPASSALQVINNIFRRVGVPDDRVPEWWRDQEPLREVQWEAHKLSNDEHAIIVHALTVIARLEHQNQRRRKVPRWLLRFALHSLSHSPLPSTSVVTSCLTIIAIDLECDPPNTTTLDERCVCIRLIAAFLTKNQDATR